MKKNRDFRQSNKEEYEEEERGHGVILVSVMTLLAVILAVVCVIAYKKGVLPGMRTTQADVQAMSNVQTTVQATASMTDAPTTEKWQEGDVRYNGKVYRYNMDIKTYLFMGIDRSGKVTEAEDSISGGQSDAMFLLVVDTANEKVSIISIHRNAMTPIDVYNADGTFNTQETMQICLQHAYGDGKRLSCDRTQDAVQRLFYNIPISGYVAMNMDGITVMNDALGGVSVDVLEDLKDSSGKVVLKKGEHVKLKGDMATLYLRGRDTDQYDSASGRLKRQEQYLINLAAELSAAASEEEDRAMDAYTAAQDYVVSSVDFASMVSQLVGYGFDPANMYTIPGQVQMGDKFEEFIVDQDGLYDLIIRLFYKEVAE